MLIKNKRNAFAITGAIFSIFIIFNILQIRRDINQEQGIGFTRTSILNRMKDSYPTLPKKVIIYIESDTVYFGLPPTEHVLPFQSGFGQTLLVWYNAKGDLFPACFFDEQYLYAIESQGYKECEGRGFGYFRKMDDLKKAIGENNIKAENVIAFSYISSKNSLVNVTEQVGESISK